MPCPLDICEFHVIHDDFLVKVVVYLFFLLFFSSSLFFFFFPPFLSFHLQIDDSKIVPKMDGSGDFSFKSSKKWRTSPFEKVNNIYSIYMNGSRVQNIF